jgi:sigma-E factor negative regulatory protein RseC
MLQSPDATVVAVGSGRATVSVEAGVCKRCASGRGCGAGLLATPRGPRVVEVPVANGLVLDVGDRVQLSLPPAQLLRAAWLAYGLPLVALVLATLLASRIGRGHDGIAILSAAAGVAAGAWLGRHALKRYGCLQQFIPEATARAVSRPHADP